MKITAAGSIMWLTLLWFTCYLLKRKSIKWRKSNSLVFTHWLHTTVISMPYNWTAWYPNATKRILTIKYRTSIINIKCKTIVPFEENLIVHIQLPSKDKLKFSKKLTPISLGLELDYFSLVVRLPSKDRSFFDHHNLFLWSQEYNIAKFSSFQAM